MELLEILRPVRCSSEFSLKCCWTCTLQDLEYSLTCGDEVEDLLALLAFAQQQFPGVEAVSSGAIASDYQRLRVEHVSATFIAFAYP